MWAIRLAGRLYCAEMYCSVLYCAALYYAALYCDLFYCAALYLSVLYCAALHCSSVQNAPGCSAVNGTALPLRESYFEVWAAQLNIDMLPPSDEKISLLELTTKKGLRQTHLLGGKSGEAVSHRCGNIFPGCQQFSPT